MRIMRKSIFNEIIIVYLCMICTLAYDIQTNNAIVNDLTQVIKKNFDEFKSNQQREYFQWSQILERRLDSLIKNIKDVQHNDLHEPTCDVCSLREDMNNIINGLSVGKAEHLMAPKDSSTILPLTKLGEKRYYFSRDYLARWKSANEFCQLHGMKFLKIESEEENQLIATHLKGIGGFYWISATDLGSEGNFYWLDDNEPISNKWDPWAVNEPNNGKGNENCAEISTIDYKWNDNNCDTYRNFICEF